MNMNPLSLRDGWEVVDKHDMGRIALCLGASYDHEIRASQNWCTFSSVWSFHCL